jgi:hypothetical protein
MAERAQPTTGEIVAMVGAAVVLIGSFMPVYKVDEQGFDESWSAWSNAWSLFPLLTLCVLFAVAIGVIIALTRFGNVNLPERVWIFTMNQLGVVLSLLIALTALCYVIRDMGEGLDKGIGGWLVVLGAIALAVGEIMSQNQDAGAKA